MSFDNITQSIDNSTCLSNVFLFQNCCIDFINTFPCVCTNIYGINLNVKEESNGLQAEIIMHS